MNYIKLHKAPALPNLYMVSNKSKGIKQKLLEAEVKVGRNKIVVGSLIVQLKMHNRTHTHVKQRCTWITQLIKLIDIF